MNGDQFVCLNLNDQNANPPQCYASLSDTYVTSPELQQQLHGGQAYVPGQPMTANTLHRTMGVVQAPVHSQMVIQRVGTLPRQYAHPLQPQ